MTAIDNTIDAPVLAEYAEVRKQIDELTAKKKELEPQVVEVLKEKNVKTGETDFAKFTMTERKSYKFPPYVAEMETKFSEARKPVDEKYQNEMAEVEKQFDVEGEKNKAIESGDATVEVKEGLTFKAK